MNSKERVQTALRHEEPDRVPINFMTNPGIHARLKQHYHLSHDDDEGLRCILGVDFREANAPYIGPHLHPGLEMPGINVNPQLGFRSIWVEHASGGYEELCHYPLEDADDEVIANWPLPSADDFDYERVRQAVRQYPDKALFCGGPSTGDIINGTSAMRSMEETLIALAMDDEATLQLIDRRIEYTVDMLTRTFEAAEGNMDLLWMGEDLGTQIGPLISLDLFRKHLRPRLQKLVDAASHFGIPAMIHSCGCSSWAFDDFIEMGIQAVDTLQPEAKQMDSQDLKETYGDRLTLHGCISTAGPLASGSVDETVQYCREKLEILMPGGGYCFSPTHMIQDNSPVENVVAMYETAQKDGYYFKN